MNVLIAGASGFIGQKLVAALQSDQVLSQKRRRTDRLYYFQTGSSIS